MKKNRLSAYIDLLLVSMIWGFATPVIKFTMRGIEPAAFLTYRFFISSIVAFIILIPTFKHHWKRLKNNASKIFLYSIFATTIALGLLFLGLEKTTVLDAVLITAVAPLVTAVFGRIFLKEKITKKEKLGISIAFFGTLITVLEPVFKGESSAIQIEGNILVIGYLLTNAYSAVLAKKLTRKKITGKTLSNLSFIIGFFTILPLALVRRPFADIIVNVMTLDFQYHLGVFYMAFISGLLAYSLWIKGQKTIEISEAGVFAYLMPIFSTPLAVFWLGEEITLPFVFGAIIITTGVIIAEYKGKLKKS